MHSVGHIHNLTNFSKWFYFMFRSPLLNTANQSSLSFLVFHTQGGGNKYLFCFWFWNLKKNLSPFLPNNIKTTKPKETKQLRHIIIWILKKSKKQKTRILKKKCMWAFSTVLVWDQNGITHYFFIYKSILTNSMAKCLFWWELKIFIINLWLRVTANLPVRK